MDIYTYIYGCIFKNAVSQAVGVKKRGLGSWLWGKRERERKKKMSQIYNILDGLVTPRTVCERKLLLVEYSLSAAQILLSFWQ